MQQTATECIGFENETNIIYTRKKINHYDLPYTFLQTSFYRADNYPKVFSYTCVNQKRL